MSVVKFITIGSVFYLFIFSVAPSVDKYVRHYKLAPAPSDSSVEPPSDKGYHSPASSPPSSMYKHHHTRNNITNPSAVPSYSVSPSTSKQQGFIFYLNCM